MPETAQLSSRSCDACTLCCRLPEIDSLSKPADVQCRHCTGASCSIYEDRPQLCRDFLCLWRTDPQLGDHWQPAHSHMLIYRQGKQMTVLVDPEHPDTWRQQPYRSQLAQMAAEAESDGGYLILFCGDEIVKIEPMLVIEPA